MTKLKELKEYNIKGCLIVLKDFIEQIDDGVLKDAALSHPDLQHKKENVMGAIKKLEELLSGTPRLRSLSYPGCGPNRLLADPVIIG
jgi:hypothetical protein